MTTSAIGLGDVDWRPAPIETERLRLRGYEPSDRDAVFAYSSDPETTRYMGWTRHREPSDTDAFFDTLVAPQYAAKSLAYALCEKGDPAKVIGGVGVLWRSTTDHVMELGYVLARPYWGRGYVPEAARAVLRLAFDTTPVVRIFAPIFAENMRSRRTAEKLGMQLEGVQRSAMFRHGRRWDVAVYSLLRGEL